jgi:cupin fold WbuC family metalloprotein
MKYLNEICPNIDDRNNPEVVQNKKNVAVIDSSMISHLVELAEQNERKRIRINVHEQPSDSLHEMIIVHKKGNYIPPHKHSDKTESFHLIRGKLLVVIFNDQGEPTHKISLSAAIEDRNNPFYYRVTKNIWHTVVPLSEYVVFQEVTMGPFVPDSHELAPWAPSESETEKIMTFTQNILHSKL